MRPTQHGAGIVLPYENCPPVRGAPLSTIQLSREGASKRTGLHGTERGLNGAAGVAEDGGGLHSSEFITTFVAETTPSVIMIPQHSHAEERLPDTLDFIAEYTAYLLGSGVHTSRALRNAQRLGASQQTDIQLCCFQHSFIITAIDRQQRTTLTRVVQIPSLPISFERNSDLSELSWNALDRHLSLPEIRQHYQTLIDKPYIDPLFVLITVGLANASFCKLFGGDLTACAIDFTSTLVGMAVKQRLLKHNVNHLLVFIAASFTASLCATAALRFDCTSQFALATSPLFLIPGVPLINGIIDIVEGHVIVGCSRLINALMLIVCIAVGLAATLLIVKNSLL